MAIASIEVAAFSPNYTESISRKFGLTGNLKR